MGCINRFLQPTLSAFSGMACYLVAIFIRLYRFLIKPVLRPCCRFEPSCSQYALIALQEKGLLKGLYLMGHRLLRCHPWSAGGYDPVLPNQTKEND